jgi:predicted ATPase
VSDAFDTEDLGPLAVKGKAEPVHAYRVLGVRAVPLRRRGLEQVGLASPMVGRDDQLETLRSLLGIVQAGRGRVAILLGEPGIGKSRLLAEFRRAATVAQPSADDGETVWFEGRCISYGRNLPYHLLLDLVRSILGIPYPASEAESRAALDRELAALLGDQAADSAAYLAHLLGLPLQADEADRAQIEPETMQGRYVAAMHRLLRALAGRGPVIIVCEDLHWADPASVDVMRQLMPMAAQLRILLVAALRAETESPGWNLVTQARELFGEALTEIRLQPLSETESRDLVANLLEIESLPDRVREVILARAEGNPFFVEEVVRMLIERGVIDRRDDRWVATAAVESVEIPETLHGLLLARIDQLTPEAKRSLRVASVIGRQFAARVLDRVLADTGS